MLYCYLIYINILTCSFKDIIEFSMLSGEGGSINGNFRAFGSPIAIICRSKESRGTRCNSGVEYFSKFKYSVSEYNL